METKTAGLGICASLIKGLNGLVVEWILGGVEFVAGGLLLLLLLLLW